MFMGANYSTGAVFHATTAPRERETLIGIITGKYEMMAGKRTKKRQKSRCSNDGDFGLRGRRFWRDENDGDSVPMTESWQVWTQ